MKFTVDPLSDFHPATVSSALLVIDQDAKGESSTNKGDIITKLALHKNTFAHWPERAPAQQLLTADHRKCGLTSWIDLWTHRARRPPWARPVWRGCRGPTCPAPARRSSRSASCTFPGISNANQPEKPQRRTQYCGRSVYLVSWKVHLFRRNYFVVLRSSCVQNGQG